MSDQRLQAVREQVKSQWVKQPNGTYSKPVLPAPDQNAPPEAKAAYLASGKSAQPKKRLRQSSKPMNKIEHEWHGIIMCSGAQNVRAQSITFRLANGVRFTPDSTYTLPTGRHCADEVKGPYAREDSLIKLKMAASVYPEWRWRLVWKDEAGQWRTQEILA